MYKHINISLYNTFSVNPAWEIKDKDNILIGFVMLETDEDKEYKFVIPEEDNETTIKWYISVEELQEIIQFMKTIDKLEGELI